MDEEYTDDEKALAQQIFVNNQNRMQSVPTRYSDRFFDDRTNVYAISHLMNLNNGGKPIDDDRARRKAFDAIAEGPRQLWNKKAWNANDPHAGLQYKDFQNQNIQDALSKYSLTVAGYKRNLQRSTPGYLTPGLLGRFSQSDLKNAPVETYNRNRFYNGLKNIGALDNYTEEDYAGDAEAKPWNDLNYLGEAEYGAVENGNFSYEEILTRRIY